MTPRDIDSGHAPFHGLGIAAVVTLCGNESLAVPGVDAKKKRARNGAVPAMRKRVRLNSGRCDAHKPPGDDPTRRQRFTATKCPRTRP